MRGDNAASWALLLLLTLAIDGVLRAVHLPGTLVLGPLVAAVAVSVTRPGLRLPRRATTISQAVLGCLVASAMSPEAMALLLPVWPAVLGINLLSVLTLLGLALWIARSGGLPGTTAIWGMSPGAASAMVTLAASHGSDPRVVALMQYLRLVLAALSVIAIGSCFGHPAPGAVASLHHASWFGSSGPWPLAATAGVGGLGVAGALALRRPALALMLTIGLGIAWQATRWMPMDVPPVVSALAFTAIGWNVGLGFTRESLRSCARLLPRIGLCVVAVLVASALLAAVMTRVMQVDFITAYMALNPGGMDAVMLMATSLDVDLPLILAMQVSRLILVILIVPTCGRLASRHVVGGQSR